MAASKETAAQASYKFFPACFFFFKEYNKELEPLTGYFVECGA